jgi:hypothetical protein
MRVNVPALMLTFWLPVVCSGEWHVKPFLGVSWGGNTTFLDFEQAAGTANLVIGASGGWIGEVVGLEVDVGRAPGFFQSGENLVQRSSVTTFTGNVVVAVPRRVAEYTLRPYFVGGGGLMRVRIDALALGNLPGRSSLATLDAGGGVTGFLSDRLGVNWDLRRFWSVGGEDQEEGFSFGPEQLSFWRASMALAIRY